MNENELPSFPPWDVFWNSLAMGIHLGLAILVMIILAGFALFYVAEWRYEQKFKRLKEKWWAEDMMKALNSSKDEGSLEKEFLFIEMLGHLDMKVLEGVDYQKEGYKIDHADDLWIISKDGRYVNSFWHKDLAEDVARFYAKQDMKKA